MERYTGCCSNRDTISKGYVNKYFENIRYIFPYDFIFLYLRENICIELEGTTEGDYSACANKSIT